MINYNDLFTLLSFHFMRTKYLDPFLDTIKIRTYMIKN